MKVVTFCSLRFCNQVAIQLSLEGAHLPCYFESVFITPRLPFLGAGHRELSFHVQVTALGIGEGQGVCHTNCHFTGELGEVLYVHRDQPTHGREQLSIHLDATGADLVDLCRQLLSRYFRTSC